MTPTLRGTVNEVLQSNPAVGESGTQVMVTSSPLQVPDILHDLSKTFNVPEVKGVSTEASSDGGRAVETVAESKVHR
jgi:hypothetical protein